jgi:hypothetical protein
MASTKRAFYVLAPTGVVHRISTKTYGEIRSIEAFGKHEVVHLFEVKCDLIVDRQMSGRVNEQIFGDLVKHPIQNAFFEANGTIIDHASAKAFFEAIGYTDATKKRCIAQQRRFVRNSIIGEGKFACIDDRPYRVTLSTDQNA